MVYLDSLASLVMGIVLATFFTIKINQSKFFNQKVKQGKRPKVKEEL